MSTSPILRLVVLVAAVLAVACGQSKPESRGPIAGKVALPAESILPAFPWPPPEPSARILLPRDMFHAAGTPAPSLAAVGNRLVDALAKARYFEYSFYRAPNGFALVARLERIGDDGTPLPQGSRFVPPGASEPFSLATYVRQLFFAPAGFYRQIVFVVTDQPFAATGDPVDARAASKLLRDGANRLSGDYRVMRFTDEHDGSALVYEFRKAAQSDEAVILKPGRLGARTHLERAGLYGALAPAR